MNHRRCTTFVRKRLPEYPNDEEWNGDLSQNGLMDDLEICRFFAVQKIILNAFSLQSIRKMRSLVFLSDLIEHKLSLGIQLYISLCLL